MKLYTYPKNYRAWKILIVAAYNRVDIQVPDFKLDAKDADNFLNAHPLGRSPVLDTEFGAIHESNASARYVARLRDDTHLYGKTHFEGALVDQWLSFSAHQLEPARNAWIAPLQGFQQFNQQAYEAARKGVEDALRHVDRHLLTRTFLVGHQVTLADIAVAAPLVALFAEVLDENARARFPNVTRWFETLINQKEFQRVVGAFHFAQKERRLAGQVSPAKSPSRGPAKSPARVAVVKKAAPAAKPASPKKSPAKKAAPAAKTASPKKAAPAPKTAAKPASPKKSPAKPASPKKSPAKKAAPAAKTASPKKAAPAPKTAAKAASPKKSPAKPASPKKSPAKPASPKKSPAKTAPKPASPKKSPAKAKNPLDALPKSEMNLDSVKKLFYAEETNEGFFNKFWPIFDAAGYSFYEAKYNYNNENTVLFMTCNLAGGYIQRLDALRRYAFGALVISGNEPKGPFHVTGVWLFRGHGIPNEMKECPDSEYYTWHRLDTAKPADRKRVASLFGDENLDGLPVQERKFFR